MIPVVNKRPSKGRRGGGKPPEISSQRLKAFPAQVIRYMNYFHTQTDTYTTRVSTDVVATSSVGGVINPVFPVNPSGYAGWASLAAAFDEFRIIGSIVDYCPFEFNGMAVQQGDIAMCTDYDSNAAITSYGQIDNYSSEVYQINGKTRVRCITTMDGAENAQFIGSGLTTPFWWVKVFGGNNTISTTLGQFFIALVVQLRGRGV